MEAHAHPVNHMHTHMCACTADFCIPTIASGLSTPTHVTPFFYGIPYQVAHCRKAVQGSRATPRFDSIHGKRDALRLPARFVMPAILVMPVICAMCDWGPERRGRATESGWVSQCCGVGVSLSRFCRFRGAGGEPAGRCVGDIGVTRRLRPCPGAGYCNPGPLKHSLGQTGTTGLSRPVVGWLEPPKPFETGRQNGQNGGFEGVLEIPPQYRRISTRLDLAVSARFWSHSGPAASQTPPPGTTYPGGWVQPASASLWPTVGKPSPPLALAPASAEGPLRRRGSPSAPAGPL